MRSTHARVRTSAALHASLLSASEAPSQSCASMTQCSSSASRDPVARQGRCLLGHGTAYLPAAGVKASSMMGTAASTKQAGGVALLGGVYTSVEWQPACWGREVLLVTLSSRSTRRDKGQNPRNCRRTRLCAPHSSPFDRDISARLGISSPRPRSQCACLVRYSCLLPPLLSCAASVEDIIYTCKRNVQWLLVGLCHERSSNHEP